VPDDDRAASTLAEIEHNHRQHVSPNFPAPGICVSRCADKWPCEAYRSATAAQAALKLADDWDGKAAAFTAAADRDRGSSRVTRAMLTARTQVLQDCAKTLREAIGAALAGKETGDGT